LGAPQTPRLLAEFGNCFTAGKNGSKERKKKEKGQAGNEKREEERA